MHIVVADEDGGNTGIANTILEIHPNVSKAINARSENGTDIYYKNYINKNSRWVWWNGHVNGITGGCATTFQGDHASGAQSKPVNASLQRGRDGAAPRAVDYINGYNLS